MSGRHGGRHRRRSVRRRRSLSTPDAASARLARPRSIGKPAIRCGRPTSIVMAARVGAVTDDRRGRRRSSRRRARRAARRPDARQPGRCVGSTPRSNRFDASLGSLCRRAVRAIVDRVEVRSLDQDVGRRRRSSRSVSPPITPARPIGPESSVISRSSASSVAVHAVEGGQLLARPRPGERRSARAGWPCRSRGSAARARA